MVLALATMAAPVANAALQSCDGSTVCQLVSNMSGETYGVVSSPIEDQLYGHAVPNGFGAIEYKTESTAVAQTLWLGDIFSNSGLPHVEEVIEAYFYQGDLILVGSNERIEGQNGWFNINSAVSYRYLSVHFGNLDALYDFGSLVSGNDVWIRSEGQDLSNTRSFSPVPLPAAGWLFGSAVLGLAGLTIRKTKSS